MVSDNGITFITSYQITLTILHDGKRIVQLLLILCNLIQM